MEGIQKLMNEVKVIKFQKGDILVVKLDNKYSHEQKKDISKQIQQIIPKDLHVQVVISTPDIEFEILRRYPKDVSLVDDENHVSIR